MKKNSGDKTVRENTKDEQKRKMRGEEREE